MKLPTTALLIANIWLALSFLTEGANRIFMTVFAVCWTLGFFVAFQVEQKKKEQDISLQKEMDDKENHNKRFYIKDGKIIDRQEVVVDGYQEVKKK